MSEAVSDDPYAVLLMALGTPNSLDEMAAYLSDVRGGRPTPSSLVEEMQRRYALVGGRSPLLDVTRAQARALANRLNAGAADGRARVYVGMRHWHPYIHETMATIVHDGLRDIVALPLTPHFSRLSVGAYLSKAAEARESLGGNLNLLHVTSWHTHPLFLRAVAEKVVAARERFPAGSPDRILTLFTAHSLPVAIIDDGDPYGAQVEETARLLARQLDLRPGTWQVCYQSAGAVSVPWLGPQLKDVVVDLAQAGWRQILVVPIGFVSDHVEILYDIDIEAREQAEQAGARLERSESLNDSPLFIDALAAIVRERLDQARSGVR